jgi:hypothetical protein
MSVNPAWLAALALRLPTAKSGSLTIVLRAGLRAMAFGAFALVTTIALHCPSRLVSIGSTRINGATSTS